MRLEDVQPIDRESATKTFSSNDPYKICDALLRITYHDSDWKWVQDKCIYYLSSEDIDIRGLAVACLGHLARIHHALDTKTVLPLLKSLVNDPDIGGRAEDAIDDIEMFVK